jgi:hypothetical protein
MTKLTVSGTLIDKNKNIDEINDKDMGLREKQPIFKPW